MIYPSAINKNKILLFVTIWVDLKGCLVSEISQTESQLPCDFTYVVYKLKTSEHRNRLRKQTGGFQRGWGQDMGKKSKGD